MTPFLVVVCSRCGGFVIARAEQKTRTCPYCGFKVGLVKAKKAASAETAYEASEILRKLKKDAALKKKNV
jgi:DNA-directed RNA polymerase subunit RPC12/RpoP